MLQLLIPAALGLSVLGLAYETVNNVFSQIKAAKAFENALMPKAELIKITDVTTFKSCSDNIKKKIESDLSSGCIEVKMPNPARFVTQEAYVCAIVHVICQYYGLDLRFAILNAGGIDKLVKTIIETPSYEKGFSIWGWGTRNNTKVSDRVTIRFKDVGIITFHGLTQLANQFTIKTPVTIEEYSFNHTFSDKRVTFYAASSFVSSPLGDYLDEEFYRRITFEEAFAKIHNTTRSALWIQKVEKHGMFSRKVKITFNTGETFYSEDLYTYFFPTV